MINRHLPLVNQKLNYASVLLGLPQVKSGTPLEQKALAEAALAELGLGFCFYLRELAENCAIKRVEAIGSLIELNEALTLLGKTSSDVQELTRLADENSWLAQMLEAYADLQAVYEPVKKAFEGENLIAAVDITEKRPGSPSGPFLSPAEWLANFREMLIRHRVTSAEY